MYLKGLRNAMVRAFVPDMSISRGSDVFVMSRLQALMMSRTDALVSRFVLKSYVHTRANCVQTGPTAETTKCPNGPQIIHQIGLYYNNNESTNNSISSWT